MYFLGQLEQQLQPLFLSVALWVRNLLLLLPNTTDCLTLQAGYLINKLTRNTPKPLTSSQRGFGSELICALEQEKPTGITARSGVRLIMSDRSLTVSASDSPAVLCFHSLSNYSLNVNPLSLATL